jgi:hypothetical protein
MIPSLPRRPLSAVLNTPHNLAFYLETMGKVREELAAALRLDAPAHAGPSD